MAAHGREVIGVIYDRKHSDQDIQNTKWLRGVIGSASEAVFHREDLKEHGD
jgi:hypothetical protein